MSELLNTHTDGQLVVLSIASRVSYQEMKKKYDKKDNKHNQGSYITEDRVEPHKKFKEMTAKELDAYYQQIGI